MGINGGFEYTMLKNADLNTKLTVSVKEGSMLPKDAMSKREEALGLFKGGALDPVTLYSRLDYPNPMEAAKKLFLWKTAPDKYLGLASGINTNPGQPAMPLQKPQINMPGQGAPAPQVKPQSQSLLSAVPIPK